MHEYCMSREDLDYVMDVTKFKTKGNWNPDPMGGVPTALKSAFTRHATASYLWSEIRDYVKIFISDLPWTCIPHLANLSDRLCGS